MTLRLRGNRTTVTVVLDDEGYRQALHEKLIEEAAEALAADNSGVLDELADVYEVLAFLASC